MTGLIIDKFHQLIVVEVQGVLFGLTNADIKNSIFRELKIGDAIDFSARSRNYVEQRYVNGEFYYTFEGGPF